MPVSWADVCASIARRVRRKPNYRNGLAYMCGALSCLLELMVESRYKCRMLYALAYMAGLATVPLLMWLFVKFDKEPPQPLRRYWHGAK